MGHALDPSSGGWPGLASSEDAIAPFRPNAISMPFTLSRLFKGVNSDTHPTAGDGPPNRDDRVPDTLVKGSRSLLAAMESVIDLERARQAAQNGGRMPDSGSPVSGCDCVRHTGVCTRQGRSGGQRRSGMTLMTSDNRQHSDQPGSSDAHDASHREESRRRLTDRAT